MLSISLFWRMILSEKSATFRDHALNRHPHYSTQTAKRAVGKRDVAAMGARDVARDREPEPGAAFVLIARVVEPQERLEHLLAHRWWDSRSIVVDGDGEPAGVAMAGDRDGRGKPRRVRYQVGEAALEGG